MLKNTLARYGAFTKTIHWATAILVIGMLCAGLYMTGMDAGLEKLKLYNLHKSIGVAILALVVLRILWHAWSKPPAFVASLKPWEKRAAKTVHFLLYCCLLAMPLSGWVMSSAAGRPVQFFGLFTLPDLVPHDHEGIRIFFHDAHAYIGWFLIFLIFMHVAAALKHHVIDKDPTLRRMLPFAKGE